MSLLSFRNPGFTGLLTELNQGFSAALTSVLPQPDHVDNRLSSFGITNSRLQLLTTNSASYDAGHPYPSIGWNVDWSGNFEAAVDHIIETYSTGNILYIQFLQLIATGGRIIQIGAVDAWGFANQVSFNASTGIPGVSGSGEGFGTGPSGPPINANGTYTYKITRVNGILTFFVNGTVWFTTTSSYNEDITQIRLTTARYLSTTSPSANYRNLYFGDIR